MRERRRVGRRDALAYLGVGVGGIGIGRFAAADVGAPQPATAQIGRAHV